MAINFLASGMTALIGQNWFGMGGQTPQLAGDARFLPITLPFAETIGTVPVIGPVYQELISGNNILVYVALAAVPVDLVGALPDALRAAAAGRSGRTRARSTPPACRSSGCAMRRC